MIVVKLMGGLGNQMFQYAAARSLALRHGVPLKLDLSFLESDQVGYTRRAYNLDHFCLTSEKAASGEICDVTSRGKLAFFGTVGRFFQNKIEWNKKYCEKSFHFDPQLLSQPDNVYLEGYWQSERYFIDVSDIIRKDFTVENLLTDKNLELADEIHGVNSVSLHVRRGDYVINEKNRAFHGGCSLGYYRNAEEMVEQTIIDPHFFVFSDDPRWVADNLKLRHPARYISHNGSMAHEDLRLMSFCRHHIIANSTFSWWGAWLSAGTNKLVIAPDHWFSDPSINTVDLIPSGWLRL